MSAHWTVDGKPVSYSSWAAELTAFFEDQAEDPREQHDREDFERRHFDFAVALTHSDGPATKDRTPAGGGAPVFATVNPSSRCDAGGTAPPAARDLTVRSHEAKRTESPPFAAGLNGGAGNPHAGPVDLQPWERYAWTPEAA